MEKTNPSLILYLVSAVVFIISVVFNNDSLGLITKSVVIPSIFLYYLQESRNNRSWTCMLCMFFFFVGDAIALISFENYYIGLLAVYVAAYLVFIMHLYKIFIKLNFYKLSKYQFLSVVIGLFLLMFIYFNTLDVIIDLDVEFEYLIIFAATLLLCMGIIGLINYLINTSKCNYYLLIAVFTIILSDIFYILKQHYPEINLLSISSNVVQTASHFFFIKYFIIYDRQKSKETVIEA